MPFLPGMLRIMAQTSALEDGKASGKSFLLTRGKDDEKHKIAWPGSQDNLAWFTKMVFFGVPDLS